MMGRAMMTVWLLRLILFSFGAPFTAGAQPAARVPKIGFLQAAQNENTPAFFQGLRDAGYVDGQSARIEARYYGAQADQLSRFANELVALKCDVILAAAPYAIRAAITATKTIPVVGIDLESDLVASGWARSLSRPGGNLTGVFLDLPELGGKQIELLRNLVTRWLSALCRGGGAAITTPMCTGLMPPTSSVC